MAVTKIYAIRKNLCRSVSYASNEKKTGLDGKIEYAVDLKKTEQRLFQSCLNCNSVETAYEEMQNTKRRWSKEDDVLGYHFIQSFAPGETTPEQAHKIGIEFARQCFGDKFEVVIGTHLDKQHLHNHVVVNSVSFIDGVKYHSSPESYYTKIRATSDRLCAQNELSVIENPKGKGLHYAEWKALKEGKPTIRGQIRTELDEIIKCSYTMRDFWSNLQKRGYVIHRKGEKIKHISIIAPYAKRPVRIDNLGINYTEEAIGQRIITARNGIRVASPTQLSKKAYKFKGNFKNIKPKKLKGFIALYFHYMYLFKKIRKKQTPQRVSFFMREELVKMERYQKQFKFLVAQNIETAPQLQKYQTDKESEIDDLIFQRKTIYSERSDENEEQTKEKVSKINEQLKACRSDVRLCKAIFKDAYRISQKYHQANELEKQAEKEVKRYEHKR